VSGYCLDHADVQPASVQELHLARPPVGRNVAAEGGGISAVTSYSVHIEHRGDDPAAVTPDALGELVNALNPHGGVVTGGGESPSWGASIFVDADSALNAATEASVIIRCAALETVLPDWPIVRVEVVREDVLDEDNERSNWPDLVSAPEAAEILGVTPQRVHVLAAQNKRFPRPVYELRSGKIWTRAAIERFNETWERKPGRPRTTPDVVYPDHEVRVLIMDHRPGEVDEPAEEESDSRKRSPAR
jgi:hypothetical protein